MDAPADAGGMADGIDSGGDDAKEASEQEAAEPKKSLDAVGSLEQAVADFDTQSRLFDSAMPSSNEGTAELSAGGACNKACRAFASLQRSAERLCELAGDDDDRCGRAKGSVNKAERRLADARCNC